MDSAQLTATVENYYAALSAMNPAAWTALFAEDGEICDPVGSPTKKVSEASGPFFELLQRFYAEFAIDVKSLFVSGNGAAAQWQMNVTAKNQRQATAAGISVFEFNDAGFLQKVSSYWDEGALMQQLKG